MTWDPTPWFVGGGAQHSPEVARLLAYASTGAAEGIVTPGDLRVVQQDVAGSSIRVLAGAALILNRAAGGTQQTYVARNISEDVKGISATGSGAGRSDLVVAEIRDPFMPGTSFDDPPDPTKGQYIFTTIVPNVSPTTTKPPAGMSGIALARIDLPANTAKVTTSMIKDLRKLAQPRSERAMYSTNAAAVAEQLTAKAAWVDFPRVQMQVEVPEWATFAEMRVNIAGLGQFGPRADARLRGHIGTSQVSGDLYLDADTWYDGMRHSTIITTSGYLNQADRGKVVTLKVMGIRAAADDGVHTGLYGVDGLTHVGYDVQFSERAV